MECKLKFSLLLLLLLTLSWVSAGRKTPPHDHHQEEAVDEEEEELKSLGSRPPSCTAKCGGCIPCGATLQMPTTDDHLRLQYTNYEHQGWKCKCGSSIYNP